MTKKWKKWINNILKKWINENFFFKFKKKSIKKKKEKKKKSMNNMRMNEGKLIFALILLQVAWSAWDVPTVSDSTTRKKPREWRRSCPTRASHRCPCTLLPPATIPPVISISIHSIVDYPIFYLFDYLHWIPTDDPGQLITISINCIDNPNSRFTLCSWI